MNGTERLARFGATSIGLAWRGMVRCGQAGMVTAKWRRTHG